MDSNTINKYRKRSLSWLVKKAQEAFNNYIRLRDSQDGYFRCISCECVKDKSQLNAGHFYSAGHHSGLRFHEDNCHGQCVRCNMYLSGNLINYQKGLIKKIGVERFEKLDNERAMRARGFKYDRFTLIEIIEKYRKKAKEIGK